MLGASDFGGLAEHPIDPARYQPVIHVADRRTRRQAGRSVGLTTLGRDPELVDAAGFASELRGPLDILLSLARGSRDRIDVAVLLDREPRHRLARLGDAVDDPRSPSRLDPNDDHSGDIGVGAGPDERAEEQLEVCPELQTPVRMRKGQSALNVMLHRLASCIGEIVERQDDDVVADADAPVLSPPPVKGQ